MSKTKAILGLVEYYQDLSDALDNNCYYRINLGNRKKQKEGGVLAGIAEEKDTVRRMFLELMGLEIRGG